MNYSLSMPCHRGGAKQDNSEHKKHFHLKGSPIRGLSLDMQEQGNHGLPPRRLQHVSLGYKKGMGSLEAGLDQGEVTTAFQVMSPEKQWRGQEGLPSS